MYKYTYLLTYLLDVGYVVVGRVASRGGEDAGIDGVQ